MLALPRSRGPCVPTRPFCSALAGHRFFCSPSLVFFCSSRRSRFRLGGRWLLVPGFLGRIEFSRQCALARSHYEVSDVVHCLRARLLGQASVPIVDDSGLFVDHGWPHPSRHAFLLPRCAGLGQPQFPSPRPCSSTGGVVATDRLAQQSHTALLACSDSTVRRFSPTSPALEYGSRPAGEGSKLPRGVLPALPPPIESRQLVTASEVSTPTTPGSEETPPEAVPSVALIITLAATPCPPFARLHQDSTRPIIIPPCSSQHHSLSKTTQQR